MNDQTPWHVQVLQKEIETRKSRNDSFSMRAFAKMLDVPAPIVSEVLRGKRKLLPKYAEKVCSALGFSPEKSALFMNSTLQHREGVVTENLIFQQAHEKTVSKVLLEELYSKAIEEWEYFAVLSLFKLEGFQESAAWIAKRLGISSDRAKQVVLDLKQLGLLKRNDQDKLERAHSRVSSTIDVPSRSVRQSHLEMLDIAKQKLENVPMEQRFFASETMAVDMEKLDEAKQLVRDFKISLARLLESGNKTEVYQLAVQLFPLTDVEPAQTKKESSN